jgi:serine/threonine protein kinase/tetratricopeptide (TPR) repeat protein
VTFFHKSWDKSAALFALEVGYIACRVQTMNTDANPAKAIFLAAIEQCTTDQWAAYLDEACAGDTALRQEVEVLLRAHSGADSLFDHSAATLDEPTISERPGTAIGSYKLLEEIGEGGFGVVFMAEQDKPIRRKVALKILKPGMDSRQVVARFEAERQALALMDHPNIAKVLDAGTTSGEPGGVSRGRPYFVMELVKGIPMTEFCDQNQLTPRERLELFVHVCQAVQHAHQKGIIHRDLKPSNVLATFQDGEPLVKVIDFGIAKAVGQQLTDKTLFTGFAQMIGSPLYMSPEQAALSNVDVDTRTDIYALGVLLYELLTGTTPFARERFQETSYDEMRRIIQEEEPPRPSTRITTLGQAATTISEQRKSDPRRLSQLFRGELDWIIMKALEKDRNRRYETASAFAADVQRYLHDEPVQACPPSVGYLLSKFVRRNRHAVLAATFVLMALMSGVAVSTWQWRQAVKASGLAETRRAEAEQAASTVRAINDFLVKGMLAAGTPDIAQGRKVTAEEVLDQAARKIDGAFPEQPEVEAAVRMAIGSAYTSLGLHAKALPHLERALEIRQELLGEEHADTLETLTEIGDAWVHQGKYAEGEQLHRQTLERARRVLGDEHRLTLELEYLIACVVMNLGRWDDAQALLRQSLRNRTRVLGEENLNTVDTMDSLAFLLGERLSKYQEAEAMARRCLEIRKRLLGEDHPRPMDTQTELAEILKTQGKWKGAEALFRETFERARAVSPKHDRTPTIEHDLALMLYLLDRLKEAEARFQESLQLRSDPEHPEALTSRMFLAHVLVARGKVTEAKQQFRDLLAVINRLQAPADFYKPIILGGLSAVFQEQGKWSEAEESLRQAWAGLGRVLPGHFWTPHTATSLAILLDSTGKHLEADKLFRETIEVWRKSFPADHPERALTLCAWGEHLLAEGDFLQAEPALIEALRIQRMALPPEHRALGQTLSAFGWLLAQTGRAAMGEGLLREGVAICRQAWPADHWVPAEAKSRLGGCLTALAKYEDGEKLLLGSHETLEKAAGTPPQRRVEAQDRIIKLYEAWNKAGQAAQWRAKRTTLPKRKE